MMFRLTVLSIATAIPGYPQAILQHATAAAGGATAGVAGKGVSDGVDTILGKTSGILGQAVKPDRDAQERQKQAQQRDALQARRPQSDVPIDAESPGSFYTNRTPMVRAKERIGDRSITGPLAPIAEDTAPADVPEPVAVALPTVERAFAGTTLTQVPITPGMFAEVRTGTQRGDLLKQLGAPYSKIVVPESTTTFEIYRYRNGGAVVGTIELVDGTVSAVKPFAAQVP